jgi:phage/plasmid-like protein (TIGR03299 family)
MAHEVEKMMYVGDVPWHNLGHKFQVAPTLEEALVAAGLDWKVVTEPVFSGAGEKLEAQLTRRSSDNSILGVVGPKYVPLQNDKAFEFFRPFIDQKEASIETAGSLRMGKRVWVLAKINRDPLIVKGSDIVDKYVLVSNSHDGTLAVRVGFTPIRVVCNNTLTSAINSEASKLIRIKHTKNVEDNMNSVRDIMNLADSEFEATADQYRILASKDIVQKDLERYVKLVFNTSKRILEAEGNLDDINNKRILDQVVPLFENGIGNDMPEIKGTLWAAYNAVTEYLQYKRGDDVGSRLDSLWFGQGAQLNKKALETALVMAAS